MNPHASPKCAGRLLMALAAISSVFFAVGCGTGSNVVLPCGRPVGANAVGFTTGSLTGTYVFSSQGADSSGNLLDLAGTLKANGSGGITGGTMDVIDTRFTKPAQVAQPITSGSYTVSTDGRGQARLVSSYGTVVLDFVLYSPSHGLVTEFDGNGGGSGTIDLQPAPVTSFSQIAGPYAFSLAGSDSVESGLNPFAAAGAFTLNSSGVITTGVEDFNDNATPATDEPLTGTATLGSGTGPETITLTTTSFQLTVDFYPIDDTHWKFIETDYNDFLAGDAFTQTGFSSIPTGTMAFTMLGGISAPIANGGFINETTLKGSEDVNNNGTFVPNGSFTITGAVGSGDFGRVVDTLSGFNPATTLALYPSSGGVLMLETDTNNVTLGAAVAQTPGAALAPTQNYGLNLSAFNSTFGYEEDDIAQFLTTSSSFGGAVDANDNSGNGTQVCGDQQLSGSYTLDSPPTGRGEATTTSYGNGFVNFNFYAVTNDEFLLLETNTTNSPIGAQIGVGTFQLQSTSDAEGAARPVVPLAHPAVLSPVVRSRMAARRK